MSERIVLRSGGEIREWVRNNSFDIVDIDSDSPKFFQSRFTPSPGPTLLFTVEHTYLTEDRKPLVTLKRSIRSTNAEDGLLQYLREPAERSAGDAEHKVGFKIHMKPGASEEEIITVATVNNR